MYYTSRRHRPALGMVGTARGTLLQDWQVRRAEAPMELRNRSGAPIKITLGQLYGRVTFTRGLITKMFQAR
jgi:hypothetical protein